MADHWTADVGRHVAALVRQLRRDRVPERLIDQAVGVYLASVAAEHGVSQLAPPAPTDGQDAGTPD